MKLKKALVPLFIAIPLAALLLRDMLSLKRIECSLCVTFEGRRQCAKAAGPDRKAALTEAQGSACSRITSGVREAFACPNVQPEDVVCR